MPAIPSLLPKGLTPSLLPANVMSSHKGVADVHAPLEDEIDYNLVNNLQAQIPPTPAPMGDQLENRENNLQAQHPKGCSNLSLRLRRA